MIRKAIISAAGLGFLPATKAQTREMLPVVEASYTIRCGRSDISRDRRYAYIELFLADKRFKSALEKIWEFDNG